MIMTQTATAVAISAYSSYVHNCTRNKQCEPSFLAPLPDIPSLQLYVDFGQYKPAIVQFYMKDLCSNAAEEQLFANNYIVGQTPDGNWYGVFKYFDEPILQVTSFVVWLSAFVLTPAGLQERTFFTESLMIEPCDPLMKVKSCQPEGATTTGFDVNGLYYGLPVNEDFLGIQEVRYFHILWVRLGKVKELSNKATFTQSLVRNFRTTVEKIFQLETELVPRWFKDMLLALYARGAIQINGKTYLVSDLAFEPLNDDDLRWKPFVQLKETFRLYYGCDESVCSECCSPLVLDAFNEFTPESPTDESPTEESPGEESPPPGPECEIWQNTGEEVAEDVSWLACDGTPHEGETITPGSNFCAQVGTLTGPGSALLTNMGPCELELVSDNFDLANDNSTICSAPTGAVLWYSGIFGPGVTMWTDAGATTPQTGFSRVKLGSGSFIYNLDPVTGIVGAYTGVDC